MTDDVFVSHARNLEDVLLWRALGDLGAGFYIDVGAADPDRLSVTRAFYERGWRGLDVEPSPERAERLRVVRPGDVVVEAALGDTDGSTTLAALCREHVSGPVQFLRIAVGGAEAAVLAGADFTATRPWVVLVQAVRPLTREPSEAAWEAPLLRAGYIFVWFDGLSRFYVAQERQAALAPRFRLPPNVFDAYRVADPPRDRLLDETAALAQARPSRIEALQAELAARVPHGPAPPAASEAASAPEVPSSRPGGRRRAVLLAYRLVRPVLRPLVWRCRSFLTGPLLAELGALRAQQALMAARIERMQAARAAPPLDADLGRAGERLLLTLALERGGD